LRGRPLGAGARGLAGGEEEAQVGVLVCGIAIPCRYPDDHRVDEAGVRPRGQVGEAGLLRPLPQGNLERVGLARLAVSSDLQPRLLALMPAQQHPMRG
jgi:hypothetical protein